MRYLLFIILLLSGYCVSAQFDDDSIVAINTFTYENIHPLTRSGEGLHRGINHYTLTDKKTGKQKQKLFIDTTDNAFDISYYLYNLHGFLPVVAPITEPAVGYGAIGVGVFFIPKKHEAEKNGFKMPDILAAGYGLTQNGTWFTGLGYFGFWKDDHLRYRGAGGYADVNLQYYGNGDGFWEDNPAEFNIQAYGLVQQVISRVGDTPFLFGGKYIFAKTHVTTFNYIPDKLNNILPGVDFNDFDLINSGFGIIGEYEKLNNIWSPTEGARINITYNQYLEAFGGDRDYGRLTGFAHYYLPIVKSKWTSGFRAEYQLAIGDVPFYAKPFIILRGIPAMRYQGDKTFLLETEQQMMITGRWGVVGFAGYGLTVNNITDNITYNTKAWNAGGGFRYLIARMFGLKMGVDVARGPEDWAFYVVFGSGWLR